MKIKFLQSLNNRNFLKLKIIALFLFLLMIFLPKNLTANEAHKINNDKKDSTNQLSSYYLQQNYPNPFNPTTQIRYSIPAETHVTLKIFNLLGNEVAKLVDEVKPEGEYSVKFNASSLSSGIYIYRLQTNYFTVTKKMTFIK